jgi:hypothetical protein
MMPAIQQWSARGAEHLRRDSEEWKITPRHARLLVLIPFILAVVVAAAVPFRELYNWLITEDSLIEWLQFLCLLGASILLVLITIRLLRAGNLRMALLYAVVTLGVLFLTGEEISWGQRIFGWETPEDMAAVNRQGETTIHNVRGIQDLVPPAMLLASLYGACVPVVWAVAGARWEHFASRHLLVPPLCLVPAFLLAAGYRLFRLVVWPTPNYVISEYAEAMELSLYFGLAMFCWFNLRRLRQPELKPGARDARRRVHRRT